MNKREVLEIIEPHKSKLTTVKEWDDYAVKNNLPRSSKLIYLFDSWTNVKKNFSLKIHKAIYSKSELKDIALTHRSFFQSKQMWDDYSKNNGLPASATYIKAYGSWQNLKDELGINTVKGQVPYSKEEIRNILTEHALNFINRHQWDQYAKEHKLPTYKTIKKHFEYDEILRIVKKKKKINFSKEDLIKVAIEHKAIFLSASMKKWDIYASKQSLPSSATYFKKFGSWRKAKHAVLVKV